ncbi:MAG: M48 family metallopeptidase [Bacilli bacterium]|nr:M48 family metallopeptidase [Bacilli bacterium]
MKYIVDNVVYDVIITKKNNKNTYIRVKDDLKIYVTTSYFVTKNMIKDILDRNYDYLSKNIERMKIKQEKDSEFYYLGHKYDIIIIDNKKVEIMDNRIYVKSIDSLNRWLKKEMKRIYSERLSIIYNMFEEDIPYPNLRLRKMTTRWGVCNKKTITVTLNTELIKYNIRCLDYVIVHELSHLVYFNHSKDFWNLVSKYCPNYKDIKKELKD